MWDRIFNVCLATYSLGLVIFLLGGYILEQDLVIVTGILLMGVTGVAMGISGFALMLKLIIRP